MFKNLILLLALLFVQLHSTIAKEEINYSAQLIPPALLVNADGVVRNYDLNIKVVSEKEIYTTEKYAITILNERGLRFAQLREVYDKFNKIEKIKAAIYDRDGKEIRKIKASDMADVGILDFNMATDNRVKEYKCNYSVFPFTLVCEVEKKLSSSFFLPDWRFLPGYRIAAEKAGLVIDYPASLPIKYKSFHMEEPALASVEGSRMQLTGAVANIAAIENDPLARPEEYQFPTLLLTAANIEIDGYKGDFSNWQGFGRFFHQLNKERDLLPAAIKKKVHELTDTCGSAYDKIALLYDYMKQHTRYVSIQLGIGGWQTFPASFVAEKGYGDCKALTNYLKALLKEAGIPSNEALVSAGSDHTVMKPDFAANVFNHVILCVPLKQDSVWIECTSKDLPAGYLSQFTHNRNVLLITPDGGAVVRTPAYTYRENKYCSNIKVKVDSADKLHGNVSLSYSGFFHDDELNSIQNKTKDQVSKHLNSKFALPNHNIVSHHTGYTKYGKIPAIEEQIELAGSVNANRSGKRWYLSPLITSFDNPYGILPRERKIPFYISASYEAMDTTIVSVPAGYVTDYMPKNVDLDYDFGSYKCTYVFEQDQLKVVRRYIQKEGDYPAEKYADFLRLIKAAAYNGDGNKVALLKKD